MRTTLQSIYETAKAEEYNPLRLRLPTNTHDLSIEGARLRVTLSRVPTGAHDLWLCSICLPGVVGKFPTGRQCAHVLAHTIPGANEVGKSPLAVSRQFCLITKPGDDPHNAQYVKTYFQRIDRPQSITCLRCRMESFAIGDIENKFCDRCHRFHEDVPVELRLAWLQEGAPFEQKYGC
jgi:hypothetical protein